VRFSGQFAMCMLAALLLLANAAGQSVARPTTEELAAITERGRALQEYDQAAWHATDMVQTANPKTIDGQHYLAKKENGRWTVVFGALNSDKSNFLISYQAEQLAKPSQFSVKKVEPPTEDTGFYLFAARALELALSDFGRVTRPYNSAVLPATNTEVKDGEGLLYVYLYPASTKAGVFPLGGDVRYLVSADGTKILIKRQLHKTILEIAAAKAKKMVAGYHTHVLSEQPEDTDVLHVLQQDPPLPELIATPHFIYQVAADGSIGFGKSPKR
jgi:hypothetical protein